MSRAVFTRFLTVLLLLPIAARLPACPACDGQECPSYAQEAEPSGKIRILVAHYTRTGHTARMARGVAEGVAAVPEARAIVKTVGEITKEDLEAASGIVLGAPTYFANIPGEMKAEMDKWNWKMEVDFTDKVGGAFATGGGQTGGKEYVVVSLLLFMLSNRMIVAGPLYENPETGSIWGEPGSSAMTGPLDPGVSQHQLDAARRLGERVARLAVRMHAP